ncbi:dTDP-4-dehydrorhamnose reductase [Kineosporia mesophila]|uniref:dTDP-4-dehydrorhamnose reductase n=1 Tax=Kineosporia mesophila TaxID=566012 RepID=A0ABP6YXR1_9ACTN|nr:dTDP-4-dehydrorhamnose reductase [Kineosporia mesophila]
MSAPRRWWVTGASGMLGRDVQVALAGRPMLPLDREALDITDPAAVSAALSSLAPGDVVVNCAAHTAVDDAESNEAAAFAVNAVGPQNLARACATAGAHLVHISTDYVFSGDGTEPHTTDEPVAPRTAYGRSKAAGEWAVRAELPCRHWILRTAWLYGRHGASFVRTMAKLEATREFVDVVDDQHGQPTWTQDLAQRIVETVESNAPAGTYHACASGRTTWHGLATEVFRLKNADPSRVRTTTSAAFQRPAPRPAFSVLDLTAWEKAGLEPMRDWRAALDEAVRVGGVLD